MTEPSEPRAEPPRLAGEREMLAGFLDFYRATVVRKLAGLTDEQARSHPVPPSTMTPLGLLRHLTGTERWWFSIDFAALDVAPPWPEDAGRDGFELTAEDTLDAALAAYRTECESSRAAIAAAPLTEVAHGDEPPFTLRYALIHLIEETARHCGHLDLMREALDGRRGS